MTAIVFFGGSQFFLFVPATVVDDEAMIGAALVMDGPGSGIEGSDGKSGSPGFGPVSTLPGGCESTVTTEAGIVKTEGAGKVFVP